MEVAACLSSSLLRRVHFWAWMVVRGAAALVLVAGMAAQAATTYSWTGDSHAGR